MAAYWTLAETLHWIAAVRSLSEKDALGSLRDHCISGVIAAIGRRHHVPPPPKFAPARDLMEWMVAAEHHESEDAPIPAHEWKFLTWRKATNGHLLGGLERDNLPAWSDVMFQASAVMAQWPDQAIPKGRKRGAPARVRSRVAREMTRAIAANPKYLSQLNEMTRLQLGERYNCAPNTAMGARSDVQADIAKSGSQH